MKGEGNLSITYSYRIYRLLVFVILLLILTRLIFCDLNEFDQLKYVLSASVVFMVMERYYPSVMIPNGD